MDRTAGPGQWGGIHGGAPSTPQADPTDRDALAAGSDLRSPVNSTSPWTPSLSVLVSQGKSLRAVVLLRSQARFLAPLRWDGRTLLPPLGAQAQQLLEQREPGKWTQNCTPEGEREKTACMGPGAAPSPPSPKPRPGGGASRDTGHSAHLPTSGARLNQNRKESKETHFLCRRKLTSWERCRL